jgi:transposase
MSKRLYRVTLSPADRASLRRQLSAGSAPTRLLTRARILLKADEAPGGPAWTDAQIIAALEVSPTTVVRIRQRFAEGGLQAALQRRRPRREYPRALDGHQEAELIALACSPPPLGRRQWSLRLLADKAVELKFVDGVSYETVRRLLKKTASSRG